MAAFKVTVYDNVCMVEQYCPRTQMQNIISGVSVPLKDEISFLLTASWCSPLLAGHTPSSSRLPPAQLCTGRNSCIPGSTWLPVAPPACVDTPPPDHYYPVLSSFVYLIIEHMAKNIKIIEGGQARCRRQRMTPNKCFWEDLTNGHKQGGEPCCTTHELYTTP